MTPAPLAAVLTALLVLAACQNGGSGDGTAPPPPRTPQSVVFVADSEVQGRRELHAVGDEGGAVRRLSGPMVAGGSVVHWELSPDGTRVAYTADQDQDDVFRLHVAAVDGSGAVEVSQGIVGDADVAHSFGAQPFSWSPDSSRLCYLADADIDGVEELFLVGADGSDHHKINGSVGTTVEIGQAAWSPDGRHVAYFVRHRNTGGLRTDRFAINVHDTQVGGTHSVRVTGSARARWIDGMVWSPDSARIAYVSDQTTADVRELYLATPAGTATNVQVNPPLGTGSGIHFRFVWSGGRHLVYQERSGGGDRLFVHDVQGTALNRRELTRTAPPSAVLAYELSPDGSLVAYRSDQDLPGGAVELFVAPLDGSSNRKLSGPMIPDGDVTVFAWSPDGTQIAYAADAMVDRHVQVHAVGTGGATPAIPLTAHVGLDIVERMDWSPDGAHVLHVGGGDGSLFAAPADGSLQVVDLLPAGLFRPRMRHGSSPWSNDGARVVFAARDSLDPFQGTSRVLAAAIGEPAAEISGPRIAGGQASDPLYARAVPAPPGITLRIAPGP